MNQHKNEIYQPKIFGRLNPTTKKNEQNRLENKLHFVKVLLMISKVVEETGIKLIQGKQIIFQDFELVKIDAQQHNSSNRIVLKYCKRQNDYQQVKLWEKVQCFFTETRFNFALQDSALQQQLQFVINQYDTLRMQMKQLIQVVSIRSIINSVTVRVG